MAVTDLGNKNQLTNSQTITTNVLLAGVSAGNLVTVFVSDGNTAITSATVTDTKGNTYTLADSIAVQNGAAPWMLVFYSFITTPLTTSDTITYTTAVGFGSNTMNISACSATGYSTIDNAITAAHNNAFSTTFTVTAAGSAAVINEINFGFVMALNVPTVTASGWTVTGSSPSTVFISSYQVNTGTSALTYSGTLSSQWASAIIVAFKPSGGGTIVDTLCMLGVGV